MYIPYNTIPCHTTMPYNTIPYHHAIPCNIYLYIHIYIYIYIPYTALYHAIPPCHTMHTLTYHNTIPCIPHHICIPYQVHWLSPLFTIPSALLHILNIHNPLFLFLKVAKEWSRDAVALLPADSEGQHVCSDIGFCCTSGTHRGPASARLVRECLLKDGFSVAQVRHLSWGTWKLRNRCYWCPQCVLDNPAKQALFNTAYAKWCELP